jgi:hypothetical protein
MGRLAMIGGILAGCVDVSALTAAGGVTPAGRPLFPDVPDDANGVGAVDVPTS